MGVEGTIKGRIHLIYIIYRRNEDEDEDEDESCE
jgi:hypothetical protein